MHILSIILTIIIAYLIGSIPTAVWCSKFFYGIDIRNEGSKNAGATNTIRVLGVKIGIPVLLFDIFKGWCAVQLFYIVNQYFSDNNIAIIFKISLGIIAILGHIFPIFANFKGGKGVATTVGVILAIYPTAFLLVLLLFIIIFAFTKIISVASMLSALFFPFIVIFILNETNKALIVMSIIIAIFIPITHIENIKRIFHGKEKKFDFGKNRINK